MPVCNPNEHDWRETAVTKNGTSMPGVICRKCGLVETSSLDPARLSTSPGRTHNRPPCSRAASGPTLSDPESGVASCKRTCGTRGPGHAAVTASSRGLVMAATPSAAFLVAVSMLERRTARTAVPGQDAPSPPGQQPSSVLLQVPPRCRTAPSWRRRGGPRWSTRQAGGGPSPGTRCVPGSACPARPPPACSARSAARRRLR
jgi:hypothetical protein